MKKYLYITKVMALLLVIVYSCSSNDFSGSDEVLKNEIIFEDSSLRTNISPNFYDNHFYLIEKLGDNSEKMEIIDVISKSNIEFSRIENNDIKKFYFNNTDLLMYSIPVIGSGNKIIVYKYDNIYQVNEIESYQIKDKTQFELKTIDNNLFYSFQVDKENRLANFNIEDNEKMNSFSNRVYEKHHSNTNSTDGGSTGGQASCCRKMPGWSACMNCTISECGSNWVCAVAFGVAPKEMAAAFAASCIGAGPNSFC